MNKRGARQCRNWHHDDRRHSPEASAILDDSMAVGQFTHDSAMSRETAHGSHIVVTVRDASPALILRVEVSELGRARTPIARAFGNGLSVRSVSAAHELAGVGSRHHDYEPNSRDFSVQCAHSEQQLSFVLRALTSLVHGVFLAHAEWIHTLIATTTQTARTNSTQLCY
jgi:hypothetical protein